METTLTGSVLHTATGTVTNPVIRVAEGRIVAIESAPAALSDETLTAAFFDIHVHGAMDRDFMSADAAGMREVARFLALRGVAHFLATTVTAGVDTTLRALERLGRFVAERPAEDAATPVGLHLEGPFLCPAKRGVHPLGDLLAPSVETFARFQEAAAGSIRLLTLAPEMPGALELIAHAVATGVRVSLGHSNATAAETDAAIRAGASSATHTFNAMRALDHREPGLAGTVLDADALYAECIVDGVHVHPAMVRLWLRCKGEARAILVTDGMAATGMPDGQYRLGELEVEVRDGVCLSGGVLAGSVLTMDRAVRNVRRYTGTSLGTAVRLASRNPAAMLGLSHLAEPAPGAPAHFNLYGTDGERVGTILNGRRLAV